MLVADVGVRCPNCGIKFASKQVPVLLDVGYRNSELRQDFKGQFPQCEQYAVCTCPSCGRADWSNRFEETNEITVLSQPNTAAHLQFRAAALNAERQGRDFFNVGLFYLHAAWCADDANASPQAQEYRRLAADALRKSLIDVSCPVNRRMEIEYLIGEILRRAGDFESSKAHFKQVMPRLSGRFAIMARKLIRMAENYQSEAIDFSTDGV